MNKEIYLVLLAFAALFSLEIRNISRMMGFPPKTFALILLGVSTFLVGCLSGM
ncbi:MAG: hypothetical protein ACO4AU_14280 [bacterium]|jgi:hypothetical protein